MSSSRNEFFRDIGIDDDQRLLDRALEEKPSDAVSWLRQCLVIDSSRPALWTSLGIAAARAGDFGESVTALRRAIELAPGHVLSQAYLGISLDLAGEGNEAQEVLDHDGMITTTKLFPDCNEREVTDFNSALLSYIRSHPTLVWERSGKATRGGWQTEDLLNDDSPVIAKFHAEMLRRLHVILCESEEVEERKHTDEPSWKLIAWGVALRGGGYQEPHVHQAGILSGVYYVQIPKMWGAGNAGCLRFPRRLPWLPREGDCEAHDPYLIQPIEGSLVIFPSYFWHETVPFESDGERVSIAFDLLPLEED